MFGRPLTENQVARSRLGGLFEAAAEIASSRTITTRAVLERDGNMNAPGNRRISWSPRSWGGSRILETGRFAEGGGPEVSPLARTACRGHLGRDKVDCLFRGQSGGSGRLYGQNTIFYRSRGAFNGGGRYDHHGGGRPSTPSRNNLWGVLCPQPGGGTSYRTIICAVESCTHIVA